MMRSLLSLAVALAIGSCSAPDGSLVPGKHADTLRIGYAVEAPYALVSADGQVTGESPEIARRIAERREHLRILERFGFSAEELPGSATTTGILAP
jgi:hypothetical protein